MRPNRGSKLVSALVGTLLVWTCSNAFQPGHIRTQVAVLRKDNKGKGLLASLCHLRPRRARFCPVLTARTSQTDDEGEQRAKAAVQSMGHSSAAGQALSRPRAVPQSDKSAPEVSPRAATDSPRDLAVTAAYTPRTEDIPGTWRAVHVDEFPLRPVGEADSGALKAGWGMPHVEISNGGRVRHGTTVMGQSLLRGLPQLRNVGDGAAEGEGVPLEGKATSFDEACEAYPQRWRVEGEGKYEQTSSIRFLDGWAETFPAVVDASSGFVPPLSCYARPPQRCACCRL
jgi:hypothetical protein